MGTECKETPEPVCLSVKERERAVTDLELE